MKKLLFVLVLFQIARMTAFSQYVEMNEPVKQSVGKAASLESVIGDAVARIKLFTEDKGLKTALLFHCEYPDVADIIAEDFGSKLLEAGYSIMSREEHKIVLTNPIKDDKAYVYLTELELPLIIYGNFYFYGSELVFWYMP